jgi:hypothetical protein
MRKLSMALLAGVALVGCGVEQDGENQEIVSNLVKAGFQADDISVTEAGVVVGGDAVVNLAASQEMLQSEGSGEQYRTSNLVASTVTKICVIPTSQFEGYSRLSAGLDMAIDNYNSLNLSFVMVRGSAADCSATISARTTSGTGGSAGFPSGGKPYGTINIGVGLQNYSDDVSEHVITHELGHCIGFRHTDYYDRSISCGGGYANEGASNVGAIHIPGTPTDARVGGSIMNACFRATESGEWSSSDKTALSYLY